MIMPNDIDNIFKRQYYLREYIEYPYLSPIISKTWSALNAFDVLGSLAEIFKGIDSLRQ